MTLKETIAEDIDLVLDLDDFAETAVVEGKEIKVQFDSDRLGELTGHTQYALGLDADAIIQAKMDQNEAKYPVEKCRGRNTKYDQLD